MKKCKLVKGQFGWDLIVDGEEIPFQGSSNADYFKKHYAKLGYNVVVVKEQDTSTPGRI